MYLGVLLNTKEARVALCYYLVRLLSGLRTGNLSLQIRVGKLVRSHVKLDELKSKSRE